MTEQNPNPEVENKVDLNSAPKPNQMSEIKIASLSLNMGSGKDKNKLKKCLKLLKTITRMTPLKTLAKKRIPGWGLRPGLAIGCKVTVRKETATLLKRLLAAKENTLSLKNFDQNGNLSFGIPEYIDIEGMEYDPDLKIMGLEVAVTLERPGYRIKKRKIRSRKIGKHHQLTKDDAVQFIKKTFNTQIE